MTYKAGPITELDILRSLRTPKFYVRWREEFDDWDGWFDTFDEVVELSNRIKALDGEGEAEILIVVEGLKVNKVLYEDLSIEEHL